MAKKKSRTKRPQPQKQENLPPVERSFVERVGLANVIGYAVGVVCIVGYLLYYLGIFP